ncbi:LCP family protein [Sporosarcina siberiensis]|uniref:LCP family protein n=1 Tax=Sporosarcina siberiensis TaxID=1365606 RepID=A0ABW4SBV1_9BACL
MKRKEYKKAKKSTSSKRLALKISLLVVLSAFLVIVAWGVTLQKKAESAADRAYEKIEDRPKSELREVAVEPTNDSVSILFIGVDESESRKGNEVNGRSDALLVATLNKKQKTVKLLSIPRDSYVHIPNKGYSDKINHAYAFGGTIGTIDTVENLLDIPIDYYVKMNFNAFIDIVDELGGIEVEVPYDRLEKDEFDKDTIQLIKGLQHLDGRHALALARTRKLDSDVDRGKRQQMIMQAIMKEATSISSVTKYGGVIDAIGDNMKTNMRFGEMKSFLDYVQGGKPQVEMLNLEGSDWWKEYETRPRVYFWKLDEDDLERVKEEMKNHLEISTTSRNLTNENPDISDKDESANEGSLNN